MYAKLNGLEDQLAQLENRKTVLEEDIASITLKADYEPLKKQAIEELASLNKKIIEDLNNVKSYWYFFFFWKINVSVILNWI